MVMHQKTPYIMKCDYDIFSLKPCANLHATTIEILTDPKT